MPTQIHIYMHTSCTFFSFFKKKKTQGKHTITCSTTVPLNALLRFWGREGHDELKDIWVNIVKSKLKKQFSIPVIIQSFFKRISRCQNAS